MVRIVGDDKHCAMCGEQGLFKPWQVRKHKLENPRCSGKHLQSAYRRVPPYGNLEWYLKEVDYG